MTLDASVEEGEHDPGHAGRGRLEQLEKFFVNYNELEQRRLKLVGIKGAKAAVKTIKRAIRAHGN